MSTKALELVRTHIASEIHKQIKHLEDIQKKLMSKKNPTSKELTENDIAFHEIDREIAKLKYSLQGVPNDSFHDSESDSEPDKKSPSKKKVFGFKVPKGG